LIFWASFEINKWLPLNSNFNSEYRYHFNENTMDFMLGSILADLFIKFQRNFKTLDQYEKALVTLWDNNWLSKEDSDKFMLELFRWRKHQGFYKGYLLSWRTL
jgi:hypothetical protein